MTLLVALLTLSYAGQAAQAAPPSARWPIESLTVSGNSRYSAQRILAVAGLKTGDVAGKEDLEAARSRLMDSGAFSGVGYSYGPAPSRKGYRVQFEVIEAPFVYPYRFERLSASRESLESVLKGADQLFAETIPATQPVLDRYAKIIERYLASQGQPVEVTGRVVADESGQLAVVFGPAAPPPSVAEVRFTGNSAIPQTKLQNVMAGVAIGALYTEAGFRQLLDANIRPLYEALGRIRVSFPKVTAEPAADVQGVAVTAEVDEGPVYTLGEVKVIAGEAAEEQLQEAARFKTGEIADFSEIEAGLARIRKRLARQGYLKPEITVERSVLDAEKKVNLTVRAAPGPQYLYGKLLIVGLDLNAEAAIRRIWTPKPGTPFDADYPDFFLQRIREDGVFDNLGRTRAETRVDDASLTVDVTLHFR